MSTKTIFLSFDDTLFNTNDLISKIWTESLKKQYKVSISKKFFKENFCHFSNSTIANKINAQYGIDIDDEFIRIHINNVFNELFSSYAMLVEDSIICLESLTKGKFKIIAYTKLFPYQIQFAMTNNRINKYINKVMHVGSGGLNPNIITQFCKDNRIDLNNSTLVSQSLNDIAYARLINMECIGYTENYYTENQNKDMMKNAKKTLIALSVLRFVISLKV